MRKQYGLALLLTFTALTIAAPQPAEASWFSKAIKSKTNLYKKASKIKEKAYKKKFEVYEDAAEFKGKAYNKKFEVYEDAAEFKGKAYNKKFEAYSDAAPYVAGAHIAGGALPLVAGAAGQTAGAVVGGVGLAAGAVAGGVGLAGGAVAHSMPATGHALQHATQSVLGGAPLSAAVAQAPHADGGGGAGYAGTQIGDHDSQFNHMTTASADTGIGGGGIGSGDSGQNGAVGGFTDASITDGGGGGDTATTPQTPGVPDVATGGGKPAVEPQPEVLPANANDSEFSRDSSQMSRREMIKAKLKAKQMAHRNKWKQWAAQCDTDATRCDPRFANGGGPLGGGIVKDHVGTKPKDVTPKPEILPVTAGPGGVPDVRPVSPNFGGGVGNSGGISGGSFGGGGDVRPADISPYSYGATGGGGGGHHVAQEFQINSH